MKHSFIFLTILLILISGNLFTALSDPATPGDLDPTFDGDGLAMTNIGQMSASGLGVVVQPDGKIVTAGNVALGDLGGTERDDFFVVARYNGDGSPDTSFNENGTFIKNITSSFDGAIAIALQPDGKIVAAGNVGWYPGDFALMRLDAAGHLDQSFGNGGLVTATLTNSADTFFAVAIQSDGKIVATGRSMGISSSTLVTVRYNPDGSLDASFGNGGIVLTNAGNSAFDLIIQPDNKIVVAGTGNCAFVTIRYNNDGSLDTGFGVNGIVSDAIGNGCTNEGRAASLQPDGKIVVAGNARSSMPGASSDVTVIRYLSDGSRDTSFGSNGFVMTNINGDDSVGTGSLVIEPGGKIMVGGMTGDPHISLVRYEGNGALDATFGNGGIVIDTTQGIGLVYDITQQSNGQIVRTGITSYYGDEMFSLARYNSDGSLDTAFGDEGIVTDMVDGFDFVYDVALQADHKIVAVGQTYWGFYNASDMMLVRYLSDGRVDSNFGDEGIVVSDLGAYYELATSVTLQTDGKVLVAGITGNGTLCDAVLLRYDAGGNLDLSFSGDGIVTMDTNNTCNQALNPGLFSYTAITPDITEGYWHGIWETECEYIICGQINFTHDAAQNIVTGTFADGAGTLVGIFEGILLSGTWSAGGEVGSFDFWITTDGTTWYGNWNKSYYWCGYRTGGESPTPCGVATWSGDWLTECSSSCETITFTQNGELVEGVYANGEGTITATASYTALTGNWFQGSGDGTMAFFMQNEGVQFNGNWSEQTGWCGHREGSGFPDPCYAEQSLVFQPLILATLQPILPVIPLPTATP